MSSTEKLLQATLNRLRVRIAKRLVNTAAELAVIANEAPERLQQEWEIFQEEVLAEANQLENETKAENAPNSKNETQSCEIEQPQKKIAELRSKVAELSNKIEVKHSQ